MIAESIGLGLFLGLLFYEIMGLSPGGLVVPGYIALFLDQPWRLVGTLVSSLLCLSVIRFLSNHMVLFGRRKFVLTILMGFLFSRVTDRLLVNCLDVHIELQVIGYIIPGLMAHEMDRQGPIRTLLSLLFISTLVRFILLFLKGWLFV